MTERLRERKKRETRAALEGAALELCAQRGVDDVTVADIAAAADVSPRTFFNYFASRDEAILGGGKRRAERLAARLAAQPVDASVWAALRGAYADYLAESDEPQRDWLARVRLVRSSPSLLHQQRADFAEMERLLAIEVAARTGAQPEDLKPRLTVAAAVGAVRVAVNHWIDTPEAGSLADTIDDALVAVGRGLDRQPATTA